MTESVTAAVPVSGFNLPEPCVADDCPGGGSGGNGCSGLTFSGFGYRLCQMDGTISCDSFCPPDGLVPIDEGDGELVPIRAYLVTHKITVNSIDLFVPCIELQGVDACDELGEETDRDPLVQQGPQNRDNAISICSVALDGFGFFVVTPMVSPGAGFSDRDALVPCNAG